ncbi:hypothetical protein L227DRAFT_201516 [Lentinus tigrinus ALCF2SS1-6]|uniref:Uncharacterized protein n=1 Tax=Lentinus tigrinus ALCF2SS1-6 TaxID=1328759 RepID=A0A5C2S397_9APHY|nr:hypothetical protein L227DRAFT_201516 [Lentinus tigrinus ALCF2SS1-6]
MLSGQTRRDVPHRGRSNTGGGGGGGVAQRLQPRPPVCETRPEPMDSLLRTSMAEGGRSRRACASEVTIAERCAGVHRSLPPRRGQMPTRRKEREESASGTEAAEVRNIIGREGRSKCEMGERTHRRQDAHHVDVSETPRSLYESTWRFCAAGRWK